MKGNSPLEEAVTLSDAGRRPSIDATQRLQQLSVKTSLPPLQITSIKIRPSDNTSYFVSIRLCSVWNAWPTFVTNGINRLYVSFARNTAKQAR